MAWILLCAAFETSLFPASDFLEARFNPAYHARTRTEFSITADERFSLSDLSTYTARSQIRNLAFEVTRFGNSLYRENSLTFGYGFAIRGTLHAGVDVSALNCWIKDLSSRYSYAVRCGACFASPTGELGLWLNNLNIPRFSETDRVPLTYGARGVYAVNTVLSCRLSARSTETQVPFLNIGIGIVPGSLLALDLGVNSDPLWLEYGCTVRLGTLAVNYSGHNHQQLGLTHALTLLFSSH
ncbi:MAG TPA: hypothetical protein VF399_04975 [bacterium]|jgi:hypothetical protein